MPDSIPAVHEAWASVMRDIPVVEKSERNKAPGANYDFRGIDTVLNVVGPILRKHKVIVIPRVRSQEYGEILTGKNRTPMGQSRVLVDFLIVGPAGDTIEGGMAGEGFDSGDKATPKSVSVAFRDFLIQALALPTGQPDANADHYERSDSRDENPRHEERQQGTSAPELSAAEQELYNLKNEGFALATKKNPEHPQRAMTAALHKEIQTANLDDWRLAVAVLRADVGGLGQEESRG